MDHRQRARRDEPSIGLLVRGYVGLGLALGGVAYGGDAGRGLTIIGLLMTASGGAVFAIHGLARLARRRG